MTKFNPKDHMTNLKGKDYLEVKWRIVWFKDENPNGSIQTEVVNYQPLVVRASIYNNDGILVANGHGSANASGKSVVWAGREIEKAETAAIGRALAHAGYGTQFDPDSDEDDFLADSPIQRVGGNAPQSRQDAPNSSAAQNNVSVVTHPEPPVKTAAERLGTPPMQRVGAPANNFPMGDFKNRVLNEIYAKNAIHMNKSLDKLLKVGALDYATMTLEQAIEVVRTRKEADVSA